jgi:hypothetical protein
MINFKLIKSKFKKIFNPVLSVLVALLVSFTHLNVQTNSLNSISNNYSNNASYASYSNSELTNRTPDAPSINISIGSPASANVRANFDALYTGSVVMLRNVMFDKLLNIAEGPLGPHVVWSPETSVQNHDNTIVVLKKADVNIVQFMNRYTRKVLGVNESGQMESKLEVQNPNGQFNQYQSFYVDYLPNGNVYFSSVAFPDRIIHLPYGGERHDFTHFTLHDKSNLERTLQVQFKVDHQGEGANTSFGEKEEVVQERQEPTPVVQQPTPPVVKPIVNQYEKLRNGAVVVLRNADLMQSVNVPNASNGQPVFATPSNVGANDNNTLVAVNKPGTNIYQFFNKKNGKVFSFTTKGEVGDWVEVWRRTQAFDPYQSFYIDLLPNGNIVLCPLAFPHLVVNLPEGGRSNTNQHYTIWSKEGLNESLNRQFTVEVLGYGADTSVPKVETVNKPTTVTQFQSSQGTVKLVNNNPVGVVGATTNNTVNWNNFNGILDEPLRKEPVFMAY